MHITKLVSKGLYYADWAPNKFKNLFQNNVRHLRRKDFAENNFEIKSNSACDRDCINALNRLPNLYA